jgi:hypothetical protein
MVSKVHIPRIPKGCDQQGRFPEAASAASEVEEEPRPIGGGLIDCALAVALGAAIAGVIVLCWGWT